MEESRAAGATPQQSSTKDDQNRLTATNREQTEHIKEQEGMACVMETEHRTTEPMPMEEQTDQGALLDLNAIPFENMMIIPTTQIPQPNPG